MAGNRMSLYEQLTVSAHRFAKLSDPCRPSSAAFSRLEHSIFKENQHSSSSLPLSFLPPLDKAQSFTCPFFGTIEGTVLCESRFNDAARRQPAMASDVLLKSRAITEYTPGADVMMLVKGARSLSIGDGLRSASTCNEEVFSSQSEGCSYVGIGSKKGVSADALPPKPLSRDHSESHGEQDAKQKISGVETFEMGHIPQSQDKNIPFDVAVDAQDRGECGSNERCMVIAEGDHDATSCGAIAHARLQLKESMRCKMNSELALRDAKATKRTQESLFPILDVMVGGSTNSTEAPDDMQVENALNDIEAGSAPTISSKSVIKTVGQLRFWKARLALIRQQRIFSDQVFELHKLIEVQRLIAGSATAPMDEMYLGVGNMITDSDDNASPCSFIDHEENNAEAFGKQVSAFKKVGKAPAVVREANSTLCNAQANCPANTATAKNEVIAWRYSSLGVAPWATIPASTQSAASPHPPLVLIKRMESLSQEVGGGKRQKGRKQQEQFREVARGQDVIDKFTSLNPSMSALNLFPLAPTLTSDCDTRKRPSSGGKEWQGHVTKVVPRAAKSAPELAAGILSSILQERKP